MDFGANDMNLERSEDEVRASHKDLLDRLKATTGKTGVTITAPWLRRPVR